MTAPKVIFKKVLASKRNNLTELESREVLDSYKIPLVRSNFCKTVEEAVTAGKKIGFPVVMKVVSPQVIHKTDVGGVVLNVNNEHEARKAFEDINKNVKKKLPKAKIEGVLVQKMVTGGQEVIVGGKEDPTFGKVVVFGMGGIFTELLKEFSIRVVPLNKNDCLEMIKETKGHDILSGYRGKKYDIEAVINVITRVSKILEENPEIKEFDINPLVVSEEDQNGPKHRCRFAAP